MADDLRSVSLPDHWRRYIEYVSFSEGRTGADGVEVMLTREGVKFARSNKNHGSLEMAYCLMTFPQWQGNRTPANVADEISTHALYANWPVLGRRANPVNIEYFQRWPGSLVLKVRDKLLALLRRK